MDGLSVPKHGFKLLSGTGNQALAEEIAGQLGVELCRVTCSRFADGEIFVRIDENIRGARRFHRAADKSAGGEHDGAAAPDRCGSGAPRRRASRAVMPYYGYSRQDRKDQPRVAIGAKLVANMIETAGADRVLGVDFHQHQLQGFFDVPVDHLYAAPVFVSHYRKKQLQDVVVVAPDVGLGEDGAGIREAAQRHARHHRQASPHGRIIAEVVNVVGEVEGRDCLSPDDMIDTAGTVSEAARALKELGANDIYVCATHALLSGPAVERLCECADQGSDGDRHGQDSARSSIFRS